MKKIMPLDYFPSKTFKLFEKDRPVFICGLFLIIVPVLLLAVVILPGWNQAVPLGIVLAVKLHFSSSKDIG